MVTDTNPERNSGVAGWHWSAAERGQSTNLDNPTRVWSSLGMPRQPRIEYAGAIYHMMARGDRCEPIVFDDIDRHRFVGTLGECCAKTGWQVLAWVLMDNHYHWAMRTPEANLVDGMKWFQNTYTRRR